MNDSLNEGSFKDRTPSPYAMESDNEKENANNFASEDRKVSLSRSSINYPIE